MTEPTICEECGALVAPGADMRHRFWHDWLDRKLEASSEEQQ